MNTSIRHEGHRAENRIHFQQVHVVNGQSTKVETEIPVDMEMLEVLGDSGDDFDVKPTGIGTSEPLGLLGGTRRGRDSWARADSEDAA